MTRYGWVVPARRGGRALAVVIIAFCLQSARAQQQQQLTPGSATPLAVPPPLLSPDDSRTEQSQPPDSSLRSDSTLDAAGTNESDTQGAATNSDTQGAARNSDTQGAAANSDTQGAATNFGSNSAAPLSADQILAVLQQEPDAVIELKSEMADLAQQQGTPLQADSITDQMLYSKIASSPELRANITVFLRARGYVTDASPETDGTSDNSEELFSASQFAQAQGGEIPAQGLPSTMLPTPGTPVAAPYGSRRSARNPRSTANPYAMAGPQVLHSPAPYNMLSLRDLYTQLPEQNGKLKRFGSDIFLRRNAYATNQIAPNGRGIPLNIPPGPDYVVGPGDSLTISLWGGISQSLTRSIDLDGKINLPDAGPVQVAGLSLERVQGVITSALQKQYRDVQVAVTVARLRSIRVYVVGDVQRPGAFDISSLSTPLNALFAAGGPTSVGSLRVLRHYRGGRLVGEIDLYDFLLHGVQNEDRLQSGDTVMVPPVGPQITVYGAVKRPAIYELKSETTLAEVLNDAGGATVSAELGHIVIDRIDANHQRETVSLHLPDGSNSESARAAIAAFSVHDGDRVHVSAILPYSQRVVYVEGHVVRPGRMSYHDGMQLSDVLHSYQDLLPEPADRGEIVRLVPPDLHPETIDFNVPDVLIGNSNYPLEPFDTVRILGRYEADAPRVIIGGEVLRPGTYALSHGMTAAQLVRMAGGFKRDALLTDADLTSYQVVGGTKVVIDRKPIRIGDAVNQNDQADDVPLKPGDVLTVHQLTGWNDIGASIRVEGEIAHPGSYGFRQGERLSSILRRAGGFRDTSYPAGAVLIREEVRKLEESSREQLIRQIETSSASARLSPNLGSSDSSATMQLISQQQNEVLSRLRSQPATGRLVIHISADISSWENTPADIEVRAGDVLRIPKRPGFVLVTGQVYNATAITFAPGRNAGWYLHRAGGVTQIANKKEIFIVRANGSVVGREPSLWFDDGVLSTRLDPGDVLVVPQKIIGASLFWRNLLTVAQIASSSAFTAGVAGVL
ncbi:MAG TPA: SLBB domain-containing protein [Acidobacteriaceae bacterium]|jgi:protein involved in polysaccharide export with SLBB domain